MARWAGADDASIVRVATLDDGVATVLTERGPLRASLDGTLLARMAADHRAGPWPGDWCVARSWPDHHVTLSAVLPRRTVVHDAENEMVCTNADLVGLVLAVSAAPDPDQVADAVTRMSAGAAAPMVIGTRADAGHGQSDAVRRLAVCLPGVEVLTVSTHGGLAVAALRDRLAGGLTLALVGPEGHGRSALVDTLVGVGRLVAGPGVVPLPTGGAVIDTVPLRWPASAPPRPAAGAQAGTSRSRP